MGREMAAGDGLLLERGDELAALSESLRRAAAGDGTLTLIDGPAGIGKSALLTAARREIEDERARALDASGTELERDLPFGVVLQLLEPVVDRLGADEREEVFRGAAGLAGPLLGEAPTLAPATRRELLTILHGLYWFTIRLSEERPLVIVVDDLHWADEPSLRFFLYLQQRLADLRIAVWGSVRTGEEHEHDPLLRELAIHPVSRRLRLKPLTVEAVGAIVEETLPESTRDLAETCWSATQGNPFLLRELMADVRSQGGADGRVSQAKLAELTPEAVTLQVTARVRRLPAPAMDVAQAAAVLGEEIGLRQIASLAGVGLEAAGTAVDHLERIEILKGGERISFVHPLVRSAIYSQLPAAARRRAHSAAGRMLAEEGDAGDRVVAHFVLGEPGGDEEVVSRLLEAARRSIGQGTPAAAARYLSRALEEPPPSGQRAEILVDLGDAQVAAADPVAAAESFGEALERCDDPALRAQILLRLGKALWTQGRAREALDAYERGLAEADGGDPRLVGRLQAARAAVAALDISLRRTAATELDRILTATTDATGEEERSLLIQTALQRTLRGEGNADEAARLTERALGGDALLREEGSEWVTLYLGVLVLTFCDRFDRAVEVVDAALEDAQRRGSLMAYATASYTRANALYAAGRITEAIADVESALDARPYGWEMLATSAQGVLVGTLIEHGDLERAGEVLESASAETANLGKAQLLFSRSRHRLLKQDPAGAFSDAEAAGDLLQAYPNPANNPWRSYAAPALQALGRSDAARKLAAEEVELAASWGAPRPLARALRARGANEEGETARMTLTQSVEVARRSRSWLEQGRCLAELGRHLSEAGEREAARTALREALDLADRAGGLLLRGEVEVELRALGGRPRRAALRGVEALTPGELRVARLAAQGMTNRQIAESLFVTMKAVQWHLRNIYGKLDVSSRDELVATLRDWLSDAGAAGSGRS